MIDMSITQDPEWIKQREALWKPIEENYKQHLRKKDIEPIHHYFMTGTLYLGHTLSEGAQFDWFPIQNTEAWNYLFQNVIQDPLVYEKHFYSQFDDLSNRGLSPEQELELWDYFAGSIFVPVIKSRVPIGKKGDHSSFPVDQASIVAKFNLFLKGIGGDQISENSKWKQRIDYIFTLFPYIEDDNFKRKKNFGEYPTRIGKLIDILFKFLIRPKFDVDLNNDVTWLENRLRYLESFRIKLEAVYMQPAMRQLWEEVKMKYEKK